MGLGTVPLEPAWTSLALTGTSASRRHREQLLQTKRTRGGHAAAGWAGTDPGAAAPRLPPTWQRLPRPPHVLPARRAPRAPPLEGAWPPPAFGALRRSCPPIGCERRGPAPPSRGPASRRAARSRRLAAAAAEPALPARAHGAAVRGTRGSSTARRARPAAAGGPAGAAEPAEPGGALQPPRLLFPMRAARDQALHAENAGVLDAGGTAPAGASSTPPRAAPGPGTGAFLHPSSLPASPRAGGKEAARGGEEGSSRHGPSCGVRGGPGGGGDVVSVLLRLRCTGWGTGGSEGAALVLEAIAPTCAPHALPITFWEPQPHRAPQKAPTDGGLSGDGGAEDRVSCAGPRTPR